MRFIDLSHEIYDDMPVYPGDEQVKLRQVKNLDKDLYNAYSLYTGFHGGTHIDCPMHLLSDTKTMADYPVDRFIGHGVLIDARGQKEIIFKLEYEYKIKKDDIVLIYTAMDKKYGTEEYHETHPVFTKRFADFLVSKEIKVVGMDMPSPDISPFLIHKLLLKHQIFIMENMVNLEQLLDVGDFQVFAQPLKVKAEASLVRAIAVYQY